MRTEHLLSQSKQLQKKAEKVRAKLHKSQAKTPFMTPFLCSVIFAEENILVAISAQDDVIKAPG